MKTVQIITLTLACLLLSATAARAQAPEGMQTRNLLRVGWGDSMFEQLVFYPAAGAYGHTYTGHIFADYRRSLGKVVSIGAEVDFQNINWTQEGRRSRNYELCVLPTIRFTWLDREWVRLYSGLGAGMLAAWNNSDNGETLPVFDVNTIGIQIGKGHWCGSVDLGLMVALKNVHHIYMAGSRLVSVGLNYRW